MKVVINTEYGGFGLSHEAIVRLRELGAPEERLSFLVQTTGERVDSTYGYVEDILRSDPLLVQVVQELGKHANGPYATLKVIEIPDTVDYVIEEYDGWEWVAERHRTWK